MILAAVLALMQMAIVEIDSKYDGWIRVQPEDLRMVEHYMAVALASQYPLFELPCTPDGLPVAPR